MYREDYTTETEVTYGGRKFIVSIDYRNRKMHLPMAELNKKARLYIDTDEAFDAIATASHPLPTGAMFPEMELHYGNGEVIPADGTAWTIRGKYPEVDKAWDRHNRSVISGYKMALDLADLNGSAWRWSAKAGCSCPCSPGFVHKTDGRFDIFVTVKLAG